MGKHVPYYQASDVSWDIYQNDTGGYSVEQVQLAVLMDIREKLKHMCRILDCPNTQDIPRILRRIDKNTKRPTPKRSKKRKP